MEKRKSANNIMKVLLFIVIVAIIVLVIIWLKKNAANRASIENASSGAETGGSTQSESSMPVDNSENSNNQTKENKVNEEYVKQSEDGTRVNVGSKISQDREIEGFKFTNFQLTEKNNQSTLLADVENTSGKDTTDYTNIDITFFTKEGDPIITIKGLIGPLKAGDKTQLNAGLTQDIANAYDLKIEKSKD